jgi:serralysin
VATIVFLYLGEQRGARERNCIHQDLKMANYNVFPVANNYSHTNLASIDFQNVAVSVTNTTTIAGTADGFYFQFLGSFTYSGSFLSGGTLRTFNLYKNGALLGSVSEINLDIVTLATSSPYTVERLMFAGNDTVTSAYNGADIIATHEGNDVIKMGTGNDEIDGGNGTDTLILGGSFGTARITSTYNGFSVDSADGLDAIRNIELLKFSDMTVAISKGTSYGNAMSGNAVSGAQRDYILGGSGNDSISGLSGDDFLFGESGNDQVKGNSGNDLLNGGDGDDRLYGGNGNDVLRGGNGDDVLFGQVGHDKLVGGAGTDALFGGKGSDVLVGGSGRDRLDGGAGNDKLFGGAGFDMFVFGKGQDTVDKFNALNNREKIDLGNVSEITDFKDLKAEHATQVGGNVVIDDLQGNTMTLIGVDLGDLGKGDFIF